MSFGSAIYLVVHVSDDGRKGTVANLEDMMMLEPENLDNPDEAKITLTTKWGTKVEYKGPIVPLILERTRWLSNPDVMARYWQQTIKDALKGPKEKRGPKTVKRDSQGRLVGSFREGSKVKEQINLWDAGNNEDEIVSKLFPHIRTPQGKKDRKKRVQANLYRYRHLLLRPYIPKIKNLGK